jgi:hypothetical protein
MDILITKDLQNSWIFQDSEKLKWWLDLVLMADENGEIHMSLSDLSYRWGVDKSKISRFFKKLNGATILQHQMQHQVQRITICKTESYKGVCNTDCNPKCNDFATPQRKVSLSPTPPLPSKEIYNKSLNNAHAREDKLSWDEKKELAFKAQFQAEGRIIASARKTGCDALGINNYLERFMAHCQSVDFGHQNIGHFGAHFNKFVEQEKLKPLHTTRNSQSTLDWNTQIAKDLGLM